MNHLQYNNNYYHSATYNVDCMSGQHQHQHQHQHMQPIMSVNTGGSVDSSQQQQQSMNNCPMQQVYPASIQDYEDSANELITTNCQQQQQQMMSPNYQSCQDYTWDNIGQMVMVNDTCNSDMKTTIETPTIHQQQQQQQTPIIINHQYANEPTLIEDCPLEGTSINDANLQLGEPRATILTTPTLTTNRPASLSEVPVSQQPYQHHHNHQQQQQLQLQPRQQEQQQQQQQQQYQQQPVIYYSDSPAHSSNHVPPGTMQSSPSISTEWLDNICKQLIEHMNTFGICVIDNFLGSLCGEAILKEVCSLYNNGLFRKGQLVNNRLVDGRVHLVRGDSIIWVDGSERGCKQIDMLIQTLDSLIINCNRMSGNNGEFDEHVINQRTKAMIACYPGNGTHYIKHIDNPNGDGRCITSIYYLNKEWDAQRDGGLLRIFPVGIEEVANIAPLFDRVLFFWSDRRNPHEVLPAQRIRFAITVWFIDSNEKLRRQQRELQYQQQQQQQQQQQPSGNLLYQLTG